MHTGLYIIDLGWPAFLFAAVMLIMCMPREEKEKPKQPQQRSQQPIVKENNIISKRRYNF